MPSRRPLAVSALVLWACAFCSWRSLQSGAAFTVTGASPEGFPPPAHKPRAEIPRTSEASSLGGSKAGYGSEVMTTRDEYLRRKDMGHTFPVGEAAYQFPPPIPQRYAGLNQPSTFKSHCDRVYKKKFKVCQRIGENKRRRADCEYDAFRWRRTCYWKAKPYKIHPNFRENHPFHKEA